MNLSALLLDTHTLAATLAALAAFLAVLVITWPFLFRDGLARRMRQVDQERERLRQRERGRLQERGRAVSLRSEPRKLYKTVVNRFNLMRQADDGELVTRLRMAGYRGSAPVTAYLAIRLLAPVAIFTAVFLYTLFLIKPAPSLAVTFGVAAIVGALGYFAPSIYVRNRIAKRKKAIQRTWPEALDLLLITVESGMGIESAFRKVAEEIGTQSPEVAEEMALTTAELSYLQDRRQAYENLGRRTGVEGVRAVVTSLIQAEKYGTALGQALRVMAQENRDMRMSEAEKKAASLPPKLTVPMIVFFLPVLFAVIITPAAIQITAGIQ